MADDYLPPMDTDAAIALQELARAAQTLADMGVQAIHCYTLYATCSTHGEFHLPWEGWEWVPENDTGKIQCLECWDMFRAKRWCRIEGFEPV